MFLKYIVFKKKKRKRKNLFMKVLAWEQQNSVGDARFQRLDVQPPRTQEWELSTLGPKSSEQRWRRQKMRRGLPNVKCA
jgi:hypothetical protein